MPEFPLNLVPVHEQPSVGIAKRKISNSYAFTVSKLFNNLILVFAFLQIGSKLYAGNDEPIRGLGSSFKRIRSTIKFNTIGKQLAYKRKLAFEGRDSAEAYVKEKAGKQLLPIHTHH